MADTDDPNTAIIEEFRANAGKVGGQFNGAPLVLIHHVGRKTGQERVSPTMYLAAADDPAVIYVFASRGGAPTNPAWYYNLIAAENGSVEIGTDHVPVEVSEVTGAERDRIYAEQARRYRRPTVNWLVEVPM